MTIGFCNECNAEYANGAKFCGNCGAKTPEQLAAESIPNQARHYVGEAAMSFGARPRTRFIRASIWRTKTRLKKLVVVRPLVRPLALLPLSGSPQAH